jgi:hypothetical protein
MDDEQEDQDGQTKDSMLAKVGKALLAANGKPNVINSSACGCLVLAAASSPFSTSKMIFFALKGAKPVCRVV